METRTPKYDQLAIAAAARLFLRPGQVAEVRALDALLMDGRYTHATVSGYFDDPDKLATAVIGTIQRAMGVYITLNPVKPELLARACNRLRGVKKEPLTSDKDILRRQLLLVDIDPVRPSGISSSDDEHDLAIAMANTIADSLAADGWPSPAVVDSGNGAALLYSVDLAADDGGLVEKCLKALDQQFSTESISIDTSVFNAARIVRLAGTVNAKGDSIPGRSHRLATVLEVPDPFVTVPVDLLEALAATVAEQTATPPSNGKRLNGQAFDLERWIHDHNVEAEGPQLWQDGRRWILPVCPWDDSHRNRSAFIIQRANGMIGAGCHHNGCQGLGWKELRAKFEPEYAERQQNGHNGDSVNIKPVLGKLGAPVEGQHYQDWEADCGQFDDESDCGQHDQDELTNKAESVPTITPISLSDLILNYPHLRAPRIDGILRNGEVAGLIAPPKYGKSWLTYYIEGCVVAGLDLFGQFRCESCRILHIDLELHAETLANRVPKVWEAMGLKPHDYSDRIDFVPLRGKLMDLNAIAYAIEKLESNDYGLVVLDPLYRALPAGVKENENEGITQLFNTIDNLVQQIDAAWLHVHHASKGDQSGKEVTDVGSGAGAQSRAPDAHLIMRQHEEPGCMVFEGAVRSFAPINPLVLKWNFPLWTVASDLDPNAIKGRASKAEERQKEKDKEGVRQIIDVLRKLGPLSASKIKRETGMGKDRCERLLAFLFNSEQLTREKATVKGNDCWIYSLPKEDVV